MVSNLIYSVGWLLLDMFLQLRWRAQAEAMDQQLPRQGAVGFVFLVPACTIFVQLLVPLAYTHAEKIFCITVLPVSSDNSSYTKP